MLWLVNYISTALAALVRHYIEALNTPGTVPNIQNAWDIFVTTKCTEAKDSALKCYSDKMTEHLDGKLPCDDEEIVHRHDTTLQEAQGQFEEKVYGIKAISVEKYLVSLGVSILMVFICV